MTPARVLIVSNTVVSRRFLVSVFDVVPDMDVVGVTQILHGAFEKEVKVCPDVVIIDMVTHIAALEAMELVRATWPKVPVLVCAAATEPQATLLAIGAGATDAVAMPAGSASDDSFATLWPFATKLLSKLRAMTGSAGWTLSNASLAPPMMPLSLAPPMMPRSLAPPPLRGSLAPLEQPTAGTPGVLLSLRSPRVPTFAASDAGAPPPSGFAAEPYARPREVNADGRVNVLAIGCSTGGPNTLAVVIRDLPSDLNVPIFIVQHMPPRFTQLLAERLSTISRIVVVEATDGELVQPNRAYIAPGNYHMTVAQRADGVHIVLNQDPQENSCRPAVDVLFRSLARVYRGGVLAAVLTGMGKDGTAGAAHIVEAGGWVIVQDAASCVVPSMPNAVLAAGLASRVVPLDQMGAELALRMRPNARPKATAPVNVA